MTRPQSNLARDARRHADAVRSIWQRGPVAPCDYVQFDDCLPERERVRIDLLAVPQARGRWAVDGSPDRDIALVQKFERSNECGVGHGHVGIARRVCIDDRENQTVDFESILSSMGVNQHQKRTNSVVHPVKDWLHVLSPRLTDGAVACQHPLAMKRSRDAFECGCAIDQGADCRADQRTDDATYQREESRTNGFQQFVHSTSAGYSTLEAVSWS